MEATVPNIDPEITSIRPSLMTRSNASRRCAPSAARMPISRVRSDTL